MGTLTTGILMVVSPGEWELAVDGLRRALALAAGPCRVFIVDNGGVAGANVEPNGAGFAGHSFSVLNPPATPPRPYFEIARTIFSALASIAPDAPELLFKLDPDTLVLDRRFFSDIRELHQTHGADFYACHVHSSPHDHRSRQRRLLLDRLPLGLQRTSGPDRYGRALRLRFGGVWHRRILGSPGLADQPSGGFYALSRGLFGRLARKGLLATSGHNGLEWNDDTLVPMAVRAAGGSVVDVRRTPFGPHWRFMHGSRYFTEANAREPGIRALHPVKMDESGRVLRRALPATGMEP